MKTQRDYQKLAARTSGAKGVSHAPSKYGPLQPVPEAVIVRIETCSLGLIGELGEFADHIKKVVGHGHPLDKALCLKELGDIAWYVAEAYSMFGLEAPDEDIDELYARFKKELEEGDAAYAEEEGVPLDNMRAVCSLLRKMSALVAFVGFENVVTRASRTNGPPKYPLLAPGYFQQMLDMIGGMLLTLILRIGLTFREVYEANIEKLKARYPEGFNSEDSINRKE